MIDRISVRLDSNLLFHPRLNDAIPFSFVLQIGINRNKIGFVAFNPPTTTLLTVIVSTVLVLLLTVCEEIISPSAVYPPSASSRIGRSPSTGVAAKVEPSF